MMTEVASLYITPYPKLWAADARTVRLWNRLLATHGPKVALAIAEGRIPQENPDLARWRQLGVRR